VSFPLLGKVSKNASDVTILRLCLCVCVRACVRERERALIRKNLSAMSDEYFPQRSIGRTGPIEMPPRSPDSTQRLLSFLRYSRTHPTAGNRGMLAKLEGEPGTSGAQRLVRGSARGFLQNDSKTCQTAGRSIAKHHISMLGGLQTKGLREPRRSKSGHTHS
jgi:hypothetical protein